MIKEHHRCSGEEHLLRPPTVVQPGEGRQIPSQITNSVSASVRYCDGNRSRAIAAEFLVQFDLGRSWSASALGASQLEPVSQHLVEPFAAGMAYYEAGPSAGPSYVQAAYPAPYAAQPPYYYPPAMNAEGEERRTIFVTGFPPDVKERELNNMLRFLPAYEVHPGAAVDGHL